MFSEKMKDLLSVQKPCIWVRTHEEKEALVAIKNILDEEDMCDNIYTWTSSNGLSTLKLEKGILTQERLNKIGIDKLFETMRTEEDPDKLDTAAFILLDYHFVLNNPNAIRGIRDVKEAKSSKYNPIIIVSPLNDVPIELEKICSVVEYEDPDCSSIEKLLDSYEKIRKVTLDDKKHLSKLFVGFSRSEIIDTLDLSIAKHNKVNITYITSKKIDKIKETGILDYKEPNVSLDTVGGNDFFKRWVAETELCMQPEARDFGIPTPKGHLALGIPGTSKTYTAEALAGKWQVPFLKLSMSKIVSKYAGETERNMAKALTMVNSCAPCVLLIDEVEKALGGIKSSNSSDSGMIARAFGQVLEFLNDNDNGVYVIMTSNDVSQLPPELTRAGRLDAIWYFSLPDEEERQEIFKVHLNKVNKTVGSAILKHIANKTKGYTGAEIEQVVKAALRKAFVRSKTTNKQPSLTKDDFEKAINQVVPISKSSKEKINALEMWANGRALYANQREKKIKINIDEDIL